MESVRVRAALIPFYRRGKFLKQRGEAGDTQHAQSMHEDVGLGTLQVNHSPLVWRLFQSLFGGSSRGVQLPVYP